MTSLSLITPESIIEDMRYLKLLSRSFPTIGQASTEIINLEAILNLPKGTEHFMSDIHGESEAFEHVLKNASGTVRRKVEEIFGQTLRESVKRDICTLIYYPVQKLGRIKEVETDLDDWYMTTLNQLVKVCQNVSSKYTRSKVRKALPKEFSYIIQELLHEGSQQHVDKQAYTNQIIATIISTKRADEFIQVMCNLIQQLAIDSLHIVGDIYDRGNGAHKIVERLRHYHNFDIQWGNHDILWMGAASGNDASMANAIRISLRYGNLDPLEYGYSINMLPLATFAMEVYGDDTCTPFMPKGVKKSSKEKDIRLIAQMHKAIAIIQFKLESNLIKKHPEYEMEGRLRLDKMNLDKGIISIDGKEYKMIDTNFPTVDLNDPFKLSIEEEQLVQKLHNSFAKSDRMRKHMNCLLKYGSIYLVVNSNLLFHASIPLNKDGSFKEVKIEDKIYKGKELLDKVDSMVRIAYFDNEELDLDRDLTDVESARDYMWYLWCGKNSPLFDKDKMATFENYFLNDESICKEVKGYYYSFRDNPEMCNKIFDEFDMRTKDSHIINGHVPVKQSKGESPLKADGKLIVIDGGFSKAYQSTTGIAGYTLVYHSHGLQLVQHEPFESTQKAIDEGADIKSTDFLLEFTSKRMRVRDTDKGRILSKQIQDLRKLLVGYRIGLIKEKS